VGIFSDFAGEVVSDFAAKADELGRKFVPFYGKGAGSSGNTLGMYRYPMTLADTQHTSRLAFTATNEVVGDEVDGGRSKAFGNYKQLKFKDIGTVFLYMPKLEQTYAQNYEEDGRGLLWQMDKILQSKGGYNMEALMAAAPELAGAFIGKKANDLAPGLIQDFAQQVYNQHLSAHFKGTALRTQRFEYELRPRNEEELKQVAGLIQFFKANSATSFGKAGDYLRVPSRWIIEEITNTASERYIPTFKFGPAYLSSVEYDYTPDGSWKTFENGDPIAITLTLEFLEITIVTREDIENYKL
jgi:hypothetical protein